MNASTIVKSLSNTKTVLRRLAVPVACLLVYGLTSTSASAASSSHCRTSTTSRHCVGQLAQYTGKVTVISSILVRDNATRHDHSGATGYYSLYECKTQSVDGCKRVVSVTRKLGPGESGNGGGVGGAYTARANRWYYTAAAINASANPKVVYAAIGVSTGQ